MPQTCLNFWTNAALIYPLSGRLGRADFRFYDGQGVVTLLGQALHRDSVAPTWRPSTSVFVGSACLLFQMNTLCGSLVNLG